MSADTFPKLASVTFAVPVPFVSVVVDIAVGMAGGATVGSVSDGYWVSPERELVSEPVRPVSVYIENTAVEYLVRAVVHALGLQGERSVAYETRYSSAGVVPTANVTP